MWLTLTAVIAKFAARPNELLPADASVNSDPTLAFSY